MSLRTAALTAGALACFAANSLLARSALGAGLADPATFTAVRLASGALMLPLLLAASRRGRPSGGSWASALALFAYAAAFSLAYLRIGAGPGALLLFAAVQTTMLAWSVLRGQRPTAAQWLGAALALAGLAFLTLPGARGSVDAAGAALMLLAGVAWGAYSLRGRTARDPLATTAANFLRAAALAVPIAAALVARLSARPSGVLLAAASGALASGVGYSIWYAAVPRLGATRAATVQLAVPVLTAAAAAALLGERPSARLAVSAVAILGGIALSMRPEAGARSRLRALARPSARRSPARSAP
jgi:drug/metabolite transporter (DMT)-like permease